MNKNNNLTKNYILESFYILLTKKHYNEISVCDICEKAGVSRMSFYRNFFSKEDLIIKSLDYVMNNLKKELESCEEVNFYILIKSIFDTFKKYKDVIPSFQDTQILKTIRYNTMNKFKENIVIDQMNKSSKYIPVFYISAFSTTLFEWLKGGAVESTEDMARLIVSLTNGNMPNPSLKCWKTQVLCIT